MCAPYIIHLLKIFIVITVVAGTVKICYNIKMAMSVDLFTPNWGNNVVVKRRFRNPPCNDCLMKQEGHNNTPWMSILGTVVVPTHLICFFFMEFHLIILGHYLYN